MKNLIFFATLVTLLGTLLASTAESQQIASEYKNLTADFSRCLNSTRYYFVNEVVESAKTYYLLYQYVKEKYQERLMLLNYSGAIIAAKITSPVNTILDKLDKLFSWNALSTRLDSFLISAQAKFQSAHDSLVNSWISAAVNNTKVINCWNRNKSAVHKRFEGFCGEMLAIVTLELLEADNIARKANETIFSEVLKIESDVTSKCQTVSACYTDYFNKNLTSIHSKVQQFGVKIENLLSNLFNETAASVNTAVNNVIVSIKTVNATFSQCLAQ